MSDHDWEAYYRLKPGDTFIEVGAFYGDDVAYLFSRVTKSGVGVFVEPNAQACNIVHVIINNLGAGNLKVLNRPAWNRTEQILFYDLGDTTSFVAPVSDMAAWAGRGMYPKVMEAISMDDILKMFNLPHVDLLMADVEGVEEQVVEGALESIKQGKIRNMSVCAYHKHGTAERIQEFLATYNKWKFDLSHRNGLSVLHASLIT